MKADVEKTKSCLHWSGCDSVMRTSVAGTVAPSTEASAIESIRPWYIWLPQCVKGYIIKLK